MKTDHEIVTEQQAAFLIEEFKSLRSELSFLSDMSFRVERNCAGGIVLIYGFILSDSFVLNRGIEDTIWVFPPIISAFCLRRMYLVRRHVFSVASYIETCIEPALAPSNGGWQRYSRDNSQSRYQNRKLKWTPSRMWLLILFLTSAAAVLKLRGDF